MPRESFEKELNRLQDQLLLLGSMVEQAVSGAVEALKARDITASERIYKADRNINVKRYEIEHNVLTLIATQQPMARDLRLLAAILEIITELERIGDYAKGICRITVMLGDAPLIKPLIDIPKMADLGLSMLHRSLEAFVRRDAEAARAIPLEDDQVDKLYNDVVKELIQIVLKDTSTIDQANYLTWAAHNLERLADRVTNICERIVFVVTGEILEMDQTDDENTSILN